MWCLQALEILLVSTKPLRSHLLSLHISFTMRWREGLPFPSLRRTYTGSWRGEQEGYCSFPLSFSVWSACSRFSSEPDCWTESRLSQNVEGRGQEGKGNKLEDWGQENRVARQGGEKREREGMCARLWVCTHTHATAEVSIPPPHFSILQASKSHEDIFQVGKRVWGGGKAGLVIGAACGDSRGSDREG